MTKRFLIVLAVLALTGAAIRHGYHWHHVPTRTVDPTICTASGPIVSVTEYTGEPGVYHVRCQRGPTMVIGSR